MCDTCMYKCQVWRWFVKRFMCGIMSCPNICQSHTDRLYARLIDAWQWCNIPSAIFMRGIFSKIAHSLTQHVLHILCCSESCYIHHRTQYWHKKHSYTFEHANWRIVWIPVPTDHCNVSIGVFKILWSKTSGSSVWSPINPLCKTA